MSEQTANSSVKPRYRGNPANMTRMGMGRKPGVPNKIHTDVKKLAQSYGPDAIRKLAEMGGLIPGVAPARPNSTQAYALDKLLDRAYGKAHQAHSFEGEDGELLGVVMIPMKRAAGMADHAAPDNPSNDVVSRDMPMQIEGRVVDDGRAADQVEADAVEAARDAEADEKAEPAIGRSCQLIG